MSIDALAQGNYVLDIKSENFNIVQPVFYISEIADERTDQSNAGQVLSENKSVRAKFKHSLPEDLKIFFNSIETDTTKIPIAFVFERFSLTETGTISNHKVSLDYSIKFYRLYNGNRYSIYDVNGKPSLSINGPYPHAQEKLINQVLKSTVENFSKWISDNSDMYILAKKVKVIYEDSIKISENSGGDSIVWKDDYKLNWKDFKANPPQSEFIAESNSVFYYAAKAVVKDRIIELHINLFSCFDRNTSWVKEAKADNALLAHEQLHFDISELQIRLLRKKLLNADFDIVDFDKQIHALIDQAQAENENQQKQYDLETQHGIVAEKQLSWKNEISNQLKNTSVNGSVK
jgi:hypothetical protein